MKLYLNYIKQNFLFFLIFIFISFTFYRFLYFQLENIDEVNYLSDSLLLLEGISPSFKHSPSGITTWIGSIYLFFEFFIYSLFSNFPGDIRELISNFDYIIFKNYLDLTNIKLILFLLNLSLLFYFYTADRKRKLFFYFFLIVFLSPFLINLTFSGKPYFTASLLCALSFILKEKNKTLSHILFGLAVAEKFEFILLINFFAMDDNKFFIKNYFLIILVFFAAAPWWTASFFQNIKINLHFVIDNLNSDISDENSKLNILFFLFYFFGLFFIHFIKTNKNKLILIFFLFISMLQLLYVQSYYIRWFQPLFVYFCFTICSIEILNHNYEKIKNFSLIFSTIFLILLHNTELNSDLEILKIEKNSKSKNVISYGLLKEDLDFKNYVKEQIPNFNKRNIKNINHFGDENSPISFSVSGNLEINFIRRYEYLAKYHQGSKDKFIIMGGGLPSDIKFWCSKEYNNENTEIITFGNREKIINCESIK